MAAAPEFRFPCANCGADLRYAPGQTELACPYCGFVQPIPAAPASSRRRALAELDLARGLAQDLDSDATVEIRTTSCPSCGAQIEFDGVTFAKECPFCATPVVIDPGTQRQIRPQAVLPFVLTEDQARTAMVRWMGSLWFAPSALVEYARKGRALAGVYVPFWTYDAETQSRYSGQRGEYYYETRTVTVTVNGRRETRQEQVQKTRWYPASGRVARVFDDVLVMASKSLPARLGNDLTPWDLTALQPYAPDYLAGFRAESYTIPLADGSQTAKEDMTRVIQQDVMRDIGGDVQRIDSLDTDYRNETFKHILLPVWMAAYKYNGRSFRFLVNGQTGEVQGERPWSVWKIAFTVLVVLAVGAALVYLNDPNAFRSLTGSIALPDWMGN
ncbi:MAG: primosomal protein N' (replication factor Y) - superfamily II helicase [Pseudomonadota bacterium]